MTQVLRYDWPGLIKPDGNYVKAEDYDALAKAARELLQYIDDHDWGLIPEGKTADQLRDLLVPAQTVLPQR